MQPALPQYDIGVLVGRFQVHELHSAHRDLIQHVCDHHEKVVIFLGLSPLSNSANNPLDFESRKQMILAEFPEITVLYIKDMHNDEVWSKKLDEQINDVGVPGQSVVLYGSRDSFISHYTGQFPTQELLQETFVSGSEVRKSIARSRTRANAAFRAGVIWASQARFPTSYTTVDVAILKRAFDVAPPRGTAKTQLLLGRKANETLYRFVGGFSDPRSDSFEADAKREVREETGLEVGDLSYVGSMVVDDWRYRSEPDAIKTMLFTAQYLHGRPAPADDIVEVKWFSLEELDQMVGPFAIIVPEHRPLMGMLVDHLNRKES